MSTQQLTPGAGSVHSVPPAAGPGTGRAARANRSTGNAGLIVKIVVLGLAAALAVWGAFPLVAAHAWAGLAALVAVTALIFYVYLSPRPVPAKYLLPGTLFLIAFQVIPVLMTATTAFSNFGDGHRGSEQDAITAIQTASVVRVPGSPEYGLTVASEGDPATGPLVFLLADERGRTYVGTAGGLRPLDGATVTLGRVSQAPGYTPLSLGEASARSGEITSFTVPTTGGAIRSSGISRAYEGQAGRRYDPGCDCVRDTTTGHTWKADPRNGSFVDAGGDRLAQGWRVDVGLRNFARVLTDPDIARPFLGTLVWNFAFAILSVAVTFVLGMACALALHSDRVRGRSVYRVLLVLPYAMPSFAMLLVWRDMYNQDFGLVNRLFHVDVDWLGNPWTARLAVILVQLWLGYPYMFLVATGALQAIPAELTEAAAVDGAAPWQRLRRVTLPLLLVALSPLLIASFAYNFNNFNAIYLTSEGGPFPATNTSVGATDLLITYTYRLAFGAQGAQYGFAAAISVFIFLIVATVSAISFRHTRRQEEVYG